MLEAFTRRLASVTRHVDVTLSEANSNNKWFHFTDACFVFKGRLMLTQPTIAS